MNRSDYFRKAWLTLNEIDSMDAIFLWEDVCVQLNVSCMKYFLERLFVGTKVEGTLPCSDYPDEQEPKQYSPSDTDR